MLRAFPIGRLAGIRLDVHPSWFVIYAFVAFTISRFPSIAAFGGAEAAAIGALAALALFASVVLHELAHALVASAGGVRTESIELFLFGGIARLDAEPAGPVADALVAVAGPAVSALLAAAAYGALRGVDRFVSPGRADAAAAILAFVMLVNVVLAAFNLIPAYPLDGGRVLRALIWRLRGTRDGATASAALVGIGFAVLFALGGIVAAVVTRTWQFGMYVLLAGYLARECGRQYAALRPRSAPLVAAPSPAPPAGAVTA